MRARALGSIFFTPPAIRRAGVARSEVRVSAPGAMPVELVGWLRPSERDHVLGPRLGLEAFLKFPLVGAEVLVRSRPDTSAPPDETGAVRILPQGERMAIRLAPVRVASAKPWSPTQHLDAWHASLTDAVDVECAVDSGRISGRFLVAVELAVWLSVRERSGPEGTALWLDSELVFTRGLTGRLSTLPRELGAVQVQPPMGLPLVRPGTTFRARAQSITVHPVPGSSLSLRFLDGDGRVMGDERVVGQCAQPQ